MAYPRLRSMNMELANGATDGKYKKIRPNVSCVDPGLEGTPSHTVDNRMDADDVWHGFHEAATMHVPGLEKRLPTPYFIPNRPADMSRW